MGKIILVSGANGSGKSAFAENLVQETMGRRYYIATMVAHSEENHQRIEKHRQQRKGLDFTTLELPCRVGAASVEEGSVVLLEDASNLMANAMFEQGRNARSVCEDILALAERCRLLIVVTISGLVVEAYSGETSDYISALQAVNDGLYERAAAAVMLEGGVPQWLKGGREDVG